MLFLFNLVYRLKGFLANQAVRYLTRLLLGRYAVRALLDFAGVRSTWPSMPTRRTPFSGRRRSS